MGIVFEQYQVDSTQAFDPPPRNLIKLLPKNHPERCGECTRCNGIQNKCGMVFNDSGYKAWTKNCDLNRQLTNNEQFIPFKPLVSHLMDPEHYRRPKRAQEYGSTVIKIKWKGFTWHCQINRAQKEHISESGKVIRYGELYECRRRRSSVKGQATTAVIKLTLQESETWKKMDAKERKEYFKGRV